MTTTMIAAAVQKMTTTPSKARRRPSSENSDPNLPGRSRSTPRKPSPKNPIRVFSPPTVVKERRFIVAKKKNKNNNNPPKEGGPIESGEASKKFLYETLRASQEGFLREAAAPPKAIGADSEECAIYEEGEEERGSVKVRKMRSQVMAAAVESMPEQGSGRVKHLVKAFERLLSIPRSDGREEGIGGGEGEEGSGS
ncbi:hypothetical protein QJS10_CPB15g01464 [Acorus calamus]|uniref:Calmodulin-binding domain-containing protein n=1 Tax=Acorus calamus TaxID=4465 RepID=A0AAV9D586_ACOCL|nr:hypothetical protein QJS10_CPB15g01464 [Acorus calamus]